MLVINTPNKAVFRTLNFSLKYLMPKRCYLFLQKSLHHKCLGGPKYGSVKTLAMNVQGIKTREIVLEFLFNKVAGLNACNFIKKRLQHRRCYECCSRSSSKKYYCGSENSYRPPVVYLQWFSVKIYGK